MLALKARDGAERRVVHHDPDRRDAHLDGGGDNTGVGAERAVPDEGDGRAAGTGCHDTEHRRRAKPHGRETSRRQERVRRIDRILLGHAVLVPADIGHENRVGHGTPDVCQDALREQRKRIRGRVGTARGKERLTLFSEARPVVAAIMWLSRRRPAAIASRASPASAVAAMAAG